MNWLEPRGSGVLLHLVIQPRASRSEIVGLHGERLKIRINAPPVDGKANVELAEFLSDRLDIPKSQVEILRGESGRTKDVFCHGIAADLAHARLLGS